MNLKFAFTQPTDLIPFFCLSLAHFVSFVFVFAFFIFSLIDFDIVLFSPDTLTVIYTLFLKQQCRLKTLVLNSFRLFILASLEFFSRALFFYLFKIKSFC